MIHYLFVYGTLLDKNFDKLNGFMQNRGKVIDIKPGFIEGKMYNGSSFPMVVELGELTKPKMPNICYGGIAEIESDDTLFWEILDAYEGCSLFRTGENNRYDLYHRKQTEARIIDAKSINDLERFDYDIIETKPVWVYFANPESLATERYVNRQDRIIAWKSFTNFMS